MTSAAGIPLFLAEIAAVDASNRLRPTDLARVSAASLLCMDLAISASALASRSSVVISYSSVGVVRISHHGGGARGGANCPPAGPAARLNAGGAAGNTG